MTPHSIGSRQNRSYKRSLVIPCCKECNVCLSNKGATLNGEYNIASKAEYLYNHYRNVRYKKYVDDETVYDEEFLEDFGDNLKKNFRNFAKKRDEIKERLEHLKVMSRQNNLKIPEVWDKINDKSKTKPNEDLEILMKATGSVVVVENYHYVTDSKPIADELGCPLHWIDDVLNGLSVEELEITVKKSKK